MRTPARLPLLAFSILSFGLVACGSSGGPANAPTPDGSLSEGGCAGSCGAEAMADAPSPDSAEPDASVSDADAGPAPDGSLGDAAVLDASRDSQGPDGPAVDGGRLDGSTFVCGSVNPVSCAAGTEYCLIVPSNPGELPMPLNTCEALTVLPCFSTNAGCNCTNLPLEVDAGGCRCLPSDASSGLTIDCF